MNLIKIVVILELRWMKEQIIASIGQNIRKYEFFTLFTISQKFSVEWLEQKC